MNDIAAELRRRIERSVKKNISSGLLFSGGLDTSILAALNPGATALSVSLESFGEDIRYSRIVSGNLRMRHIHRRVDIDEAIDSVPEVIRILKTFDPAIPNDIVVYFGLKKARELGRRQVMTGDGSDEIFAGYDFMSRIDDLAGYIKKISSALYFSSNEMGKFFGIEIIQPYLDPDVLDLALDIPAEFKIRKEAGGSCGKWILRKAFEPVLPAEVIWQSKRPLECGSGMNALREVISSKIRDEDFDRKAKEYPVRFIGKEHLYYYELYKEIFGEIPPPQSEQKACPGCGAGLRVEAFHCHICGWAEALR